MQRLYKRILALTLEHAGATDDDGRGRLSLGFGSMILMRWFVEAEPIAGRPVSDKLSVDVEGISLAS